MTALNGKCKFQLEFIERAAVGISGSVRGVLGVIMFDTTKPEVTKKNIIQQLKLTKKIGQKKIVKL